MQIQEKIKLLFDMLNPEDQNKMIRELEKKKNKRRSISIKDITVASCPFCGSSEYSKNGHRGSLRRYICKRCNKVFTGKTGTFIHGIKEGKKFDKYFKLMFEQYLPLEVISKKVGISIQTAFDWRHKILSGLKISTEEFKGITEVDDVWFLYSQKGRKGLKYSRKRGGSSRKGDNEYQVKLLMTVDREKQKDLSVVKIGRISKTDIQRKIGGKFNESCTLVSDKHRSISSFAKAENIKHISFKATNHTAGKEYHIQNINNMATRLKNVVNHQLHGISTKYLQNYSNWFGQMEEIKNESNRIRSTKSKLMKSKDTWDKYVSMEKEYKEFIEKYSKRTYRCPTKKFWKTAVGNANI